MVHQWCNFFQGQTILLILAAIFIKYIPRDISIHKKHIAENFHTNIQIALGMTQILSSFFCLKDEYANAYPVPQLCKYPIKFSSNYNVNPYIKESYIGSERLYSNFKIDSTIDVIQFAIFNLRMGKSCSNLFTYFLVVMS